MMAAYQVIKKKKNRKNPEEKKKAKIHTGSLYEEIKIL